MYNIETPYGVYILLLNFDIIASCSVHLQLSFFSAWLRIIHSFKNRLQLLTVVAVACRTHISAVIAQSQRLVFVVRH